MFNRKLITILIITLALCFITFKRAYADSNRLTREQNDLFISTTVGGHIPTLIAIPVRVGYFSDPDTMYATEYAKREFELEDGNVSVTNGVIENVGVSARYFFSDDWDTLNLLVGFNRRNFEVDVKVNISDPFNSPFGGSTKYTLSHLKTEAYVLSAGLGNQWIWDSGIYLNVDWYVPAYILHSNSTSTVSTGGTQRDALTVDERNRAEDDLNDFGNTINKIAGSNGYLMITLGFAF